MVTKDSNHHQTGQTLDMGRNKTAATTVDIALFDRFAPTNLIYW